jgi:hypothetical protein
MSFKTGSSIFEYDGGEGNETIPNKESLPLYSALKSMDRMYIVWDVIAHKISLSLSQRAVDRVM